MGNSAQATGGSLVARNVFKYLSRPTGSSDRFEQENNARAVHRDRNNVNVLLARGSFHSPKL